MHAQRQPSAADARQPLDAAVLEELRAGDADAFRVVYEAHRARLYAFLFRLSRDEALASDLSQETWLRLAANARRLRPDTDVSAWLFTVARNLFTSQRRWRMLDRTRLAELAAWWSTPQPATPADEATHTDTQQRLEAAIAALPVRYRESLLLSLEGFDQLEAARMLGVSHASARQRLSRARAMLKNALALKEEL